MNEALRLAEIAEREGEVPVGAVLVRENKIIGRGYNSVIMNSDPSAHAEIEALRDAGKVSGNYRLTGCELFVTLEPCLMCFSAMMHARITRLIFGAFDEKTGVFSANKFEHMHNVYNHTIDVSGGILREKCSDILKNFFRSKR